MASYLAVRRNLAAIVALVDARLGFTEIDRNLLDFVAPRLANGAVKLLVLLTKADKLNRRELQAALAKAHGVVEPVATEQADVSLTAFSTLSRIGVDDTALFLAQYARAAAAAS